MKHPYRIIHMSLLCAAACFLLMLLASCGAAAETPGSVSANASENEPYDESDEHFAANGGPIAESERPVAESSGPVAANGGPVETSPDVEARVLRTIMSARELPQGSVPEDLNITLEFVRYAPSLITLIITNNSGYDIKYGDGYEITGKTWGSMGTADNETFELPSGEGREINVLPMGPAGFQLTYGEFRLTSFITVEHDAPSAEMRYRLHVDFAIENTEIPPDMSGVAIDVYFATPIGALLNITNGFDSGRVYYDKSFRLQRSEGGIWQDLPAIGSDEFPDEDMRSVASRQILQHYTIYWAWLYGELPAGQYRIEKSFWHRADDGGISAHRLYAEFSLDGEPVPGILRNDDGSSWSHPFHGISTFRAEVAEIIDSDFHHVSFGNIGLLVNGLTPLWDGDRAGGQYYIWDNETAAVLDSGGGQLRFSDIRQGMTVDITFSGMVLQSLPAHIGGALLVRVIVED